ncbi:WIAG-tail domain [Paenibacillus sp. P96]|uniref:WIAG-tail domain n=1 Tax=Paenibacillus zeirhizosphaerae TaxID=2987519 RepID=A0ABT9FUF7_9BACL|nr:WIAG-tail domain [Paenibacillus sp. P96]MDP4098369.1 WIAG-tail domain [Paenibacillus sp. P96]
MKKNKSTPGRKKRKRPLYYVDNPNVNELDWLQPIKKAEMQIHSVAMPRVPAEPPEPSSANNLPVIQMAVHESGAADKKPVDSIASIQNASFPSAPAVQVHELLEDKKASHMNQGFIYTDNIRNTAVNGNKKAPVSRILTSDNFSNGSAQSSHRVNKTIGTSKLGEHAVISPKLAPKSVQSMHLADDSVSASSLQAGAVQSEQVARNAIHSDHLQPKAVLARNLGAQSVSEEAIRDKAVTSSKLAEGSVTSTKLGTQAVQGIHLAERSIQEGHITDDSIHSGHLQASSILENHLAPGSVTEPAIRPESINGDALKAECVTSSKLARNSVKPVHIEEGAVRAEHLADKAVHVEHLAPGSVDSNHLQSSSVLERHITPGAITGDALREGTVQMSHLADEVQASIQELHEKVELLHPTNEASHPQPAMQQFGRIPFFIHGTAEVTEVSVTFDEPFSSPNYTLVAMTNHSAFYAVLKSQSPASAVLEIAKLRRTDQNFGLISWIAIGSD